MRVGPATAGVSTRAGRRYQAPGCGVGCQIAGRVSMGGAAEYYFYLLKQYTYKKSRSTCIDSFENLNES